MVVGIDGSDGSAYALAWAAGQTERFGPVRPVAAWQYPWWTAGGPAAIDYVPSYERLADVVRREAEDAVSGIPAASLAPLVVEEGAPGPLLVDHGADAKLIVVGTRGRGAVADALLGSVSCHVVANATVPVAVVPAGAPVEDAHHRVVVGIDGSTNSIDALAWALITTDPAIVIEVVHAWTYIVAAFPVAPTVPIDDLEADAAATLDRTIAAARNAAETDREVTRTMVAGDPRSALRAASEHADLLVVGARGHRGFLHALLGSVTTSLVHNPAVTTVVVPAAG